MSSKCVSWEAKGIKSSCKFCGGKGEALPALTIQTKGGKSHKKIYCIGCRSCGTHTLHGDTPEEAVERWNSQQYSEDTLLLMKGNKDLSEEGIERLMVGVLQNISREYIKASAYYTFAESDAERKIFRKEMKEAKNDLKYVCGWADLPDYGAACQVMEDSARACIAEVRKGIKKLVSKYLRKTEDDDGTDTAE